MLLRGCRGLPSTIFFGCAGAAACRAWAFASSRRIRGWGAGQAETGGLGRRACARVAFGRHAGGATAPGSRSGSVSPAALAKICKCLGTSSVVGHTHIQRTQPTWPVSCRQYATVRQRLETLRRGNRRRLPPNIPFFFRRTSPHTKVVARGTRTAEADLSTRHFRDARAESQQYVRAQQRALPEPVLLAGRLPIGGQEIFAGACSAKADVCLEYPGGRQRAGAACSAEADVCLEYPGRRQRAGAGAGAVIKVDD